MKKLIITALVGLSLLAFTNDVFARGGRGGENRGNDGRNYRPAPRCDYRPAHRPVYYGRGYCPRPVYVYPSRGIVISPFIVIGW